jgi:hypothetical protein
MQAAHFPFLRLPNELQQKVLEYAADIPLGAVCRELKQRSDGGSLYSREFLEKIAAAYHAHVPADLLHPMLAPRDPISPFSVRRQELHRAIVNSAQHLRRACIVMGHNRLPNSFSVEDLERSGRLLKWGMWREFWRQFEALIVAVPTLQIEGLSPMSRFMEATYLDGQILSDGERFSLDTLAAHADVFHQAAQHLQMITWEYPLIPNQVYIFSTMRVMICRNVCAIPDHFKNRLLRLYIVFDNPQLPVERLGGDLSRSITYEIRSPGQQNAPTSNLSELVQIVVVCFLWTLLLATMITGMYYLFRKASQIKQIA